MKRESFNEAQKLYDIIHGAQQDLKGIKWYEQKFYKHGVPLVLKVPYTIGPYSVDSDIVITDMNLIKDVLNTIKIHSVQTIQNAEKELEEL
jgi:hypothetical protein